VSRYQKGKTNLDFTEATDDWQWYQLGHIQVCTLLQTDNHTSTPTLTFLQARCPSCHPTNSIKALKANIIYINKYNVMQTLVIASKGLHFVEYSLVNTHMHATFVGIFRQICVSFCTIHAI